MRPQSRNTHVSGRRTAVSGASSWYYEQVPTPLAVLDGDQTIVWSGNQALADLLGYSVEELRNVEFASLLTDESLPIWGAGRLQAQGEPEWSTDVSLRRKDHTAVAATVSIKRSVPDDSDAPVSLVHIQDHTMQEELARTLVRDRELLLTVLDQMPVGVMVLDAASQEPILVNARLRELVTGVPVDNDIAVTRLRLFLEQVVHQTVVRSVFEKQRASSSGQLRWRAMADQPPAVLQLQAHGVITAGDDRQFVVVIVNLAR